MDFIEGDDERIFILDEDFFSANRQGVEDILNDFIRKDRRNAVLDFARVQRIDSNGLALLIKFRNRLAEDERTLTIINPGERVLKLFAISGMDKYLLG